MTTRKETAAALPQDWDGADNLSEPIKAPSQRLRKETAEALAQPRVTIILEDNENIGPSGQFFGADGIGYMIIPGEEVTVPQSIINVLDTAIMGVPVKDHSDTVLHYKARLRFPYRVITNRRAA